MVLYYAFFCKYNTSFFMETTYFCVYLLSSEEKQSQLNDKYNDIVVEAFRGSGHSDMPELELAPHLDWYKDVDIRKEYN